MEKKLARLFSRLELLIESGILKSEMIEKRLLEAKELAALLTASQQTAGKTA